VLEWTDTVQNEIQAIFFSNHRIHSLVVNSFQRYNMKMHRLWDITFPITRSVCVFNSHNMYSANPITDTRTVGSETSQVGLTWPTSRTARACIRRAGGGVSLTCHKKWVPVLSNWAVLFIEYWGLTRFLPLEVGSRIDLMESLSKEWVLITARALGA
jgi:hypothetical protein